MQDLLVGLGTVHKLGLIISVGFYTFSLSYSIIRQIDFSVRMSFSL